MNALDWVIVAVGLIAAYGGYRLGFLRRALSWIGLALGLFLASELVPRLVSDQDTLGAVERVWLVLVGLGVGAALGQGLGMFAGHRLRVELPNPLVPADRVLGALAGLAGVAAAVWLLVPLMADVPELPARLARGSVIAERIEEALPEPPDPFQSLRLALSDVGYPQVFGGLEASPDAGAAPTTVPLTTGVADAVIPSTVRVGGPACGRVQRGSGFVVGEELVVTNAHVVAGVESVTIATADGRELGGTVVAFDPDRDLAVVQVTGLELPALSLVTPENGDEGAVFGYPGGGPLVLSPFRVSEIVNATGTDIYGDQRVERMVLVLGADLDPGDSGAAVVGVDGDVVGVAFAVAPDRSAVAYALSTEELAEVLAVPLGPVSTGPCIA